MQCSIQYTLYTTFGKTVQFLRAVHTVIKALFCSSSLLSVEQEFNAELYVFFLYLQYITLTQRFRFKHHIIVKSKIFFLYILCEVWNY